MMKVKPVKLGKTERMSFSHIDEVISMPNLIEVQKNSYQWFLDEGLKEVFHDIGTIEDYTGNLALSFVDFRLDKEPKYSIKECKERDVTYAAPLRVTARLLNKETGEVKDQEIFMGDFPLMTDAGTFVINGAERAIVSQLVRSPGVFYGDAKDKVGNDLYSATMNPTAVHGWSTRPMPPTCSMSVSIRTASCPSPCCAVRWAFPLMRRS